MFVTYVQTFSTPHATHKCPGKRSYFEDVCGCKLSSVGYAGCYGNPWNTWKTQNYVGPCAVLFSLINDPIRADIVGPVPCKLHTGARITAHSTSEAVLEVTLACVYSSFIHASINDSI